MLRKFSSNYLHEEDNRANSPVVDFAINFKRCNYLNLLEGSCVLLGRIEWFVYAKHGRKLMGCKSPIHKPG